MNAQILVARLNRFFKSSRKSKAVIGLSGGVDSALVLWLCVKALGPQNVFVYHLPYLPNREDQRNTWKWAKKMGVAYQTVSIRKPADAVIKATQAEDRVSLGNIMARTRMNLLYAFARNHDALVIGTGNKSELLIGYFSKYGDGGVDVLPLGRLYKTEVWKMAQTVGVPEEIVQKVPTAGLWEGQSDEEEMGIRYAELDRILYDLVDRMKTPIELEKKFQKSAVELVIRKMKAAEHKLKPVPIL